jgi:hypothetical protein
MLERKPVVVRVVQRISRYIDFHVMLPGLTQLAAVRTNLVVQAGPFRSMRYVHQSHWSQIIPKFWLT